ncbi:hypothetical protein ACEPAH_6628 [Sanghuangporus vaninii]
MAGLKRAAETQLTKEHADDDDDVMEIAPSDGFKRADRSILASRPMKGLPKRTNPIATTVDVPTSHNFDVRSLCSVVYLKLTPSSRPKFGSTTKTFGIPNSSFTFSASAPTSESANSQPITNDSPFKFSTPAVSSTASSAAKQLAGMISSASQPNGTHVPSSPKKPSASIQSDAELKYYATLRGLNKSLIVQIARTFEQDSYYDFTVFLDHYREFRADIDREFKESQESEGATLRNGISSPSSPSSKTSSIPAQMSTSLSMPTPPKAFAGFGAPSSTSGSSASTATGPATGGFKPNFSAMPSSSSPSLFTFNSSVASGERNNSTVSGSSGSDTKSSSSGTSADLPKPSPFGAASSTSSPFGSTSTSGPEKPSTPFGPGSGFGATSSLGRSSTFSGSAGGPSNIFGSSGAGSSTLLPAFGGAGSSAGTFSFGGVKIPSASFGGSSSSLFGSKPTSEDSKESDEATAGKPVASSSKLTTSSGSTSGSSGFSFGSSSATTASSSKDVIGTPAKPSAPASSASGAETRSSTPASGEGGEAPTEGTSPQKVLGENPNDVEGEGEEDEETLFATRGKIYRFGKKDDKPAWIEVGVGMIRIKKKKTDASIRLLSRNTANGKIMMNFKLYTGFRISQTKSILNFVGHDESGSSVTYRVRVKDEAGATEFHEAIESAASSLEA